MNRHQRRAAAKERKTDPQIVKLARECKWLKERLDSKNKEEERAYLLGAEDMRLAVAQACKMEEMKDFVMTVPLPSVE